MRDRDSSPWPAAQGFLKNNRGINDGADLPEDYMCDLYDRILNNEIKMKVGGWHMSPGQADTHVNLTPERCMNVLHLVACCTAICCRSSRQTRQVPICRVTATV